MLALHTTRFENFETHFLSDFVGPFRGVDLGTHLTKKIHMLPHDVQTVCGVTREKAYKAVPSLLIGGDLDGVVCLRVSDA